MKNLTKSLICLICLSSLLLSCTRGINNKPVTASSVNPFEKIEASEVQVNEQANEVAPTTEEVDPEEKSVSALGLMIDEVEKSIAESNDEGLSPAKQYRNKKVRYWLDYFLNKDNARFQRYLDRGERLKEVVESTLAENDIPSELYFLALIESGYSTHAYSHAQAMGVWQFIRATGRRYGLKTNYYVDERRDPILASEGAAKYLRDLYNAFQSWELSMASYNCGELRVFKTVMAGKSRDFWELTMKGRLPKETRNYVPKFIAAAILGRDPIKYGFVEPSSAEDFTPYPNIVGVEVPTPIRLTEIAKVAGIELSALKEVNPHLKRSVTPPYKKNYEIWIPEDRANQVKVAFNSLASKKLKMATIEQNSQSTLYHKVRRGENLSTIAQRYKTSVGKIKRLNNLRNSRIHPGKRLRIQSRGYHRPVAGGKTYKVRKGDNLSIIAKRNNTTVWKIKKANKMRTSVLKIGQKIILPK